MDNYDLSAIAKETIPCIIGHTTGFYILAEWIKTAYKGLCSAFFRSFLLLIFQTLNQFFN